MRYAIFSTNPKHNKEPYVFTATTNEYGQEVPCYKPAVYSNLREAKEICARMNENDPLFPYEVRDAKTRMAV